MSKERLKSPRARLFVALALPGPMREAIVAWQRAELTDPALRPVRPEALHLTLVFLGYRAVKDVDAIAESAFGGVEGRAPRMVIEPEPVGVPRGKRPRLYALGTPSPEAEALQGRVERGLVDAGFHEPEKRPFWPHLTVARVRPERRGGRKPAVVERPPGPFTERTFLRPTVLVRLVLFRSELKREGAVYEPMAELELPTAATER